jgi:hypothetical protein
MSVHAFFQAIRETSLATAVRESELAYPIILSLHLTSIAVFGGMILMTDLRLLGVALRGSTVADVIRQLRAWKRIGFVIMVTCGGLLAASKADEYYLNPYFQTKMALLVLVGVHALVFRRSVYRNPERLDGAPAMPRVAKVAACLSLGLWLGIMTAGRWIAYYEKPRAAGSGRIYSARMASTVLAARVVAPMVTWAAASGANGAAVSMSSSRMTKTVIPSET